MTYFGFGGDDTDDDRSAEPVRRPRGSRVVTWIVVAALGVIAVNIAIAVLGGSPNTAAPAPAPLPTLFPAPAVTTPALPTTPLPSGSPSPRPAPSFAPPTGIRQTPGDAVVAAITDRGDVVLADADVGATLVGLVTHEPGAPAAALAFDRRAGVVYFDRLGPCPSVWSYALRTGRTERVVEGRYPVVSPDGTRLAVIGTGCGPGGEQVPGVGVYDLARRTPQVWSASGDAVISDVDWLPDGSSVVVTVASGTRFNHHMLNVSTGEASVRDVRSALRLQVDQGLPGAYPEIAYVNGALFLAGSCCEPDNKGAPTLRTEAAVMTLEPPVQGPMVSLSGDPRGRLLFLVAGRICSADGNPCRGEGFVRVEG